VKPVAMRKDTRRVGHTGTLVVTTSNKSARLK